MPCHVVNALVVFHIYRYGRSLGRLVLLSHILADLELFITGLVRLTISTGIRHTTDLGKNTLLTLRPVLTACTGGTYHLNLRRAAPTLLGRVGPDKTTDSMMPMRWCRHGDEEVGQDKCIRVVEGQTSSFG